VSCDAPSLDAFEQTGWNAAFRDDFSEPKDFLSGAFSPNGAFRPPLAVAFGGGFAQLDLPLELPRASSPSPLSISLLCLADLDPDALFPFGEIGRIWLVAFGLAGSFGAAAGAGARAVSSS
jgi:hypothetical protein|tara:strand:+ start:406 stop:768 length:363 start_codon:yes stop_codon:yes gene_type:complete